MSDDEILTQDEVDTLLSGVADDASSPANKEKGLDGMVDDYDFAHPAHRFKAKLPLIEVINDQLADLLSKQLSTLIRQTVNVSLIDYSTQKFQDYTHSLPKSVSINRVKLHPLPGNSLFCLDGAAAFALVDGFFGGSSQITDARQKSSFTPTEQRLVKHTLDCAFDAVEKSWANIYQIKPEFIRTEFSTQITSPANPAEVMLTSKFSITVSKTAGQGEFHIAIPYTSLAPIRNLLTSVVDPPSDEDKAWSQAFSSMVFDSEVEITGIIAETNVTLGQLMNLQVGDFIPLNQKKNATLFSENIRLFDAAIGASNGMISAKLIDRNNSTQH